MEKNWYVMGDALARLHAARGDKRPVSSVEPLNRVRAGLRDDLASLRGRELFDAEATAADAYARAWAPPPAPANLRAFLVAVVESLPSCECGRIATVERSQDSVGPEHYCDDCAPPRLRTSGCYDLEFDYATPLRALRRRNA